MGTWEDEFGTGGRLAEYAARLARRKAAHFDPPVDAKALTKDEWEALNSKETDGDS